MWLLPFLLEGRGSHRRNPISSSRENEKGCLVAVYRYLGTGYGELDPKNADF
jgi:hypothetical protein